MITNRTNFRTLAALMLTAAFAACGDDATGPDGSSATVSGTLWDGGAGSALASAPTARAMTSAAFTGTASGSAQLQIFSEADGWIELGSPANVSVAMQSGDTAAVHVATTVPTGTYTRVRLVLVGFDAEIDAGAVLGGLFLDAAIVISMGGTDGRVEIEKTVTPFTLSADASARVGFDLRSEAWVHQQSAESRTAADAEVQAAVTAHVVS